MLFSMFLSAQALDAYKYVVVDNQYEFQYESNEYLLNDLAVFEINKRGLKAFKTNNVQPADKNLGICNSLSLNIKMEGSFDRRITLSFKDCDGNVVFTSKQGIGREKDNKIAYYQAMREAMTSLDEVDYNYSPINTSFSLKSQLADQRNQSALLNPALPAAANNALVIDDAASRFEQQLPNLTDVIYEYAAPSTSYKLQSNGSNFIIWNGNQQIGNLKKSGGGCYLAVAADFIGIGYFKYGVMMLEANQKGKEIELTFIKI